MSWKSLSTLVALHYPKGEGGRPTYALVNLIPTDLATAMKKALYETTILGQSAGLNLECIPKNQDS